MTQCSKLLTLIMLTDISIQHQAHSLKVGKYLALLSVDAYDLMPIPVFIMEN